jgi:hypothetical protein
LPVTLKVSRARDTRGLRESRDLDYFSRGLDCSSRDLDYFSRGLDYSSRDLGNSLLEFGGSLGEILSKFCH